MQMPTSMATPTRKRTQAGQLRKSAASRKIGSTRPAKARILFRKAPMNVVRVSIRSFAEIVSGRQAQGESSYGQDEHPDSQHSREAFLATQRRHAGGHFAF